LKYFEACSPIGHFLTAIAVSQQQKARSFELRAALSLAKLYQSTGRPADAHAALAPAREGFSSTPEMTEIAEAQALLAASEPVAAELRRRETRSKLHAGYALATMMTKGFAAEETKAALARATTATEAARTPEYWTVIYGRINADMMSGDHRAARAGVEAFLAEAEAAGLPGHAAFARRMRGFLKFLAGDLAGARVDLERALADYDERRDEGLRTLFALDLRSNALMHLGYLAWHLGDFEEAKRLTDEAIARAKELAQPGSYVVALFNRLLIGAACGRAEDVLGTAEEMRALAEEHNLKFWRATASTYADWAQVRMGEPRAEAFRAGLSAYADLGARLHEAVVMPLLAEVELAAGRREEALAAIERGLNLAAETGLDLMRPRLLRLRGDALAETDSIGAVSAYREALSVARAQDSRALALMAALALAKRLQSTGEAVEAHAVLSEALEGFAPTPLFPAIVEAQALMERLA
jgi:tetratricopeptide (TPR) repeat protein